MMELFQDYRFWIMVALGWTISAAVDTMPDIRPDSSLAYSWIFRFAHTIVGNAKSAFASAERLRLSIPEVRLLPDRSGNPRKDNSE